MASAASIRAARAELMASILALQRVCVSLANAERALLDAEHRGPLAHDGGVSPPRMSSDSEDEPPQATTEPSPLTHDGDVPPPLLYLSSSDSGDEPSPLKRLTRAEDS
jgi:hypothetical protein